MNLEDIYNQLEELHNNLDYYEDRLKEEKVWIEKRKREREQQMKK